MLVGERLKAIREAKEMSQGDVERKTGLLRCYLSRVECGHTIPSVDTLEKWARALGVSLSQLFAENGEAAKPIAGLKVPSTLKLDRNAVNALRRIGTAFSRMDVRDRGIVVAMATKFASAR